LLSGGRRELYHNGTAGTAPNAATARRLAAVSSIRCHKNTQAQPTIRDIVTKGFEAAGKSSLSGIIVARSLLLDASALLDASSVLAEGQPLAVNLFRGAGSLVAVSLLRAEGPLVEAGLLLDAGLLRLRFLV
jgi:hypothetical protein